MTSKDNSRLVVWRHDGIARLEHNEWMQANSRKLRDLSGGWSLHELNEGLTIDHAPMLLDTYNEYVHGKKEVEA